MAFKSIKIKLLNFNICSLNVVCCIGLLYQIQCISAYNSERNYGTYDRNNQKQYDPYNNRQYNNYESNLNIRHRGSGVTAVEKVEIPYPVRVGQNVQLKCHWKVGEKGFYSLRWYKNDEQFYSFLKGEKPATHNLDGIHVTVSESDDHVVTLHNVGPKAEGVYKCEIMTEGPKFKINFKTGNLTVVELPETPEIKGLRHKYEAGDTLNVTCIAANGRPAAKLEIKVNDIVMQKESGRLIDLPILSGDRPGVWTSQARLILPLSRDHTPSLIIGCYTSTHGLSVQKEVNIQVDNRSYNLLSFLSNAGFSSVRPQLLNSWLLLSIVCFCRKLLDI